MPRKAKQPPKAAADQAYGERGDQISAQQAVPLPQNRVPIQPAPVAPAGPSAAPAPTVPAPVPAGAGVAPSEADLLLQAALSTPSPEGNSLTAPTARPEEPVTAGLSTGLGPGPEILGKRPVRTPAAQTLTLLTETFGDPRLARMAARASNRGV